MGIRHGEDSRKRTNSEIVSCRAIAIACLSFMTVVQSFAQAPKTRDVETDVALPAFRNAAPAVRYIGSNMCKGCHAAIYQNFSRTDMAHSTSLPTSIIDKGWLAKSVDIYNGN